MTALPQWATDRAREWLLGSKDDAVTAHVECIENEEPCTLVDSLADLLAEVKRETAVDAAKVATGMMAEQYIETKQKTLAEVRRVVEEEYERWQCSCDEGFSSRQLTDPSCMKCNTVDEVRDEILARLEKL